MLAVARIARIVWTGCPYHVTHRGNRRADIFYNQADRPRYLALLAEEAQRARLKIWAYALMPNHVHLLVVPCLPDSMARAIGYAHQRHAHIIHRREGWTGHLWANRFYSTPLDPVHLWAAVRYIEVNPVRAGLVQSAYTFLWSSARANATGRDDPLLDPERPFPGEVPDWEAWLGEAADPRLDDAIRRNTSTGRPTGSEDFVREIELRVARPLRKRAAGRKRFRPPELEIG